VAHGFYVVSACTKYVLLIRIGGKLAGYGD